MSATASNYCMLLRAIIAHTKPCRFYAGCLLLGCVWSPAQGWRELQEQQQTATEPGLSLFFTNLTTRSERKYSWSVTAAADKQAVNITAKGSGWERIG